MDPLLLIAVLVVPFVVYAARQRKRSAIRAAASALGFTHTSGGWFGRDELHGVSNGVDVRVTYFYKGGGKNRVPWTRVSASGPAPTLTLKKQHVGSTLLRKVTGGDDLLVGDPAFDGDVIVEGEPAFLAAALDADTRRAVQRFVTSSGGAVSAGLVTVEQRRHLTDVVRLGQLVDDVADLGARLSSPVADAAGRLRHAALHDPADGVRSRALRALRRWHPAPVAAEVATLAKSDPDPRVRVQAALILGEPVAAFGATVLGLVAPEDPEALARALAKEGAEELLVALLAVDDGATRAAACTGLARVGTVRSVEALTPLTKGLFGDDRVKEAARRALESIRARLGDVDVGRLTLAENEAGALSVAQEAGAVSIARKERQ